MARANGQCIGRRGGASKLNEQAKAFDAIHAGHSEAREGSGEARSILVLDKDDHN